MIVLPACGERVVEFFVEHVQKFKVFSGDLLVPLVFRCFGLKGFIDFVDGESKNLQITSSDKPVEGRPTDQFDF